MEASYEEMFENTTEAYHSDKLLGLLGGGGGLCGNSLYFVSYRRAAGIALFFRLSIHQYLKIFSLIYIYSPPLC